jgi:protein-S-isoprenylcysteine O-methyltransferase Ste14
MQRSLLTRALTKYLAGLVLCGGLVFLPAGTLRYFGGWLFLGVLFLPMLVMGLVLLKRAPDLLEERLNAKEEQGAQKGVIAASAVMFLGGFVLCGLSFRFGWLLLPVWVQIVAAAVFLVGYALYAEVLRENRWLARTVKVEAGQQVIDSGLYGIVRHPMYFATLLMFLAIPLMLGALAALPVFLIYPVVLVQRIRNEEALLREELPGYAEYCERVKYHMLPLIW